MGRLIKVETGEQPMQPISIEINENGTISKRNCTGVFMCDYCCYYGKECHGEICLLMEAFSGERREE